MLIMIKLKLINLNVYDYLEKLNYIFLYLRNKIKIIL